ncbi:hypothetical protein ACGFRB_03960 [Streptomyces sp. NPDC048718]|uniref:hypothetical protein n=1 Tax=Streptomyces sp. NPDC048718 TaxID=3365587 RepID=UPI00371C0F68
MSRTLFVLRYRNGEPEPLDLELVREVLSPYITAAAEEIGNGVLLRTADGREVDVDVNDFCVAVSRFPPGQFFDILAQLVDRLGASVTPTDMPVALREEADRAHLPARNAADAAVIALTGPALQRYLTT